MGGMRRTIECISITEDDKYAYCGTRTGDVLKFTIDRDDIRVGAMVLFMSSSSDSCRRRRRLYGGCCDYRYYTIDVVFVVPEIFYGTNVLGVTLNHLARRLFRTPLGAKGMSASVCARGQNQPGRPRPKPRFADLGSWHPTVTRVSKYLRILPPANRIATPFLTLTSSGSHRKCRSRPSRSLRSRRATKHNDYHAQAFNEPDTIRPTLAAYSLEKFGKGVRSVCCVLNKNTGNTNTLVGGGDGTISLVNQALNKVRHQH